jgi:hypothetical protein
MRYLAEHIMGAKNVELPGINHSSLGGDTDDIVDKVEEFLAGRRRPHHQDEASVPRTNVACGFPALRSTGRLPAPRRAASSRMKFRRR